MNNVTTTLKGFPVQDVTFRGARKQSEILNEIPKEEVEKEVVKAPVSVTPEQVKVYFKTKIAEAEDSNEKRVYSQAISWIDELLEVKKKLVLLEERQKLRDGDDSETEDMIKDISKDV